MADESEAQVCVRLLFPIRHSLKVIIALGAPSVGPGILWRGSVWEEPDSGAIQEMSTDDHSLPLAVPSTLNWF